MQFAYLKPTSLSHLFETLAASSNAVLLAGGTDILLDIRSHFVRPDVVIDIKGIRELTGIRETEEGMFLGATTTIDALTQSALLLEHFPVFENAARTFACQEIRYRATVGGNIARSSPCADFPPLLMVLEAQAILVGVRGERRIAMQDFFLGPRRNVLGEGEIIKGFSLPLGAKAAYRRIGRGKGMDLAGVNVAVAMSADGVFRIALGAVAPTPVRALHAEAAMQKRLPLAAVLEACKQDMSPISDVRGTAAYRSALVERLLGESIEELLDR